MVLNDMWTGYTSICICGPSARATRREVRMHLRPRPINQHRPTILDTEHNMHQHQRERLPRPARIRHKLFHLGIILALTTAFAPAQTTQTTPRVTIHILNAQTNKPVPDERLNVSLHTDRIGFTLMPTDKDGAIVITPGDASILHLLSNFYADCRPRAELYTNYSLATIRTSGITAGNLCSSAHPAPKPGILLLFVVPKTAIRQYGQPPASNLPHSDENPHAVPDNPPPVPR